TPALRHCGRVKCVAFSPGGSRLLTACDDETARGWDLTQPAPLTLKPKRARPGLGPRIGGPLGPPPGQGPPLAVSAGVPGRTQEDLVYHATFSPDGRRLATAGWDWTARIWDPVTGQPLLARPLQHDGEVRRVTFSPDGRRVVTASLDGTA